MYPIQTYVNFQSMIFLKKFVSATFNHYLHGHAKLREQKNLQQRFANYPTQIDPLGLNGNFLKSLLKLFWPMYLPSLDGKKTGKKLLEGIKEPLVLLIYTTFRYRKDLYIHILCKNIWKAFPGLQYACNLRTKYTFPELIFSKHMLQNETILKKSTSDEREWGDILEVLVNNIKENININ